MYILKSQMYMYMYALSADNGIQGAVLIGNIYLTVPRAILLRASRPLL